MEAVPDSVSDVEIDEDLDRLRHAYYSGWTRSRIEKRITMLQKRVHTAHGPRAQDTRAMIRAEIDMLLDEHHQRFAHSDELVPYETPANRP